MELLGAVGHVLLNENLEGCGCPFDPFPNSPVGSDPPQDHVLAMTGATTEAHIIANINLRSC